MRALPDTHAWVWALLNTGHLSATRKKATEQADEVFVSAISIYEIAQKLQRNSWPSMSVKLLDQMIEDQTLGAKILPATSSVMKAAGLLDWTNRDLFDRIIAATARENDLTVVTKDRAFEQNSQPDTIW